jgi:nitrate reductase delta subunit
MPRPALDAIAGLLGYPDRDYAGRVEACARAAGEAVPEGARLVEEFRRGIDSLATEELQELFTRTFDLDPACSAELGWHLFGEQYERGLFLVKMRRLMRELGLPESTELPDHLTHVLAVLGRMEAGAAAEFAWACVIPALARMRAELERRQSSFAKLLELAARVLEVRLSLPPPAEPAPLPALRVVEERSRA